MGKNLDNKRRFELLRKGVYEKNANAIDGIIALFNIICMAVMPIALFRREKLGEMASMGWLGYILFLIIAAVQTLYRYLVFIYQLILASLGMEIVFGKRRSFLWKH